MTTTTTENNRPDDTKHIEFVNGYEIRMQYVTAKAPATRAGRFILIDKGPDYTQERWVTAWQGFEPGMGWDHEWGLGHYFRDEDEAIQDLLKRIKTEQNYRRDVEARS